MANQQHLDLLKEGTDTWNPWRKAHPEILPDLSGTNLSGTNLKNADLRGADLRGADLSIANLIEALLNEANLSGTNLNGALLRGVNLRGANLSEANLRGANLRGANLNQALIIRTNLRSAILNDCSIYGIAAWDVQLKEANQLNLIITPPGEPVITVDNLKIAQFIYLLLNNQEIRDVINTIISKVVLILGRFTPERKIILNALRDELRVRITCPSSLILKNRQTAI